MSNFFDQYKSSLFSVATRAIKQAKTLLFSMTASQIVAGMLGAIIILLITHFTEPQPKPVGTVDITQIVNQFVQSQAKSNLSTKELQRRVNDFGKQLQATLNDISQQQHVVLMVQEAVIAGGNDYTQQVKDRLKALPTTDDQK